MRRGVLPLIDRQILLFERWLLEHLDTITDTEQRWNRYPRSRSTDQ